MTLFAENNKRLVISSEVCGCNFNFKPSSWIPYWERRLRSVERVRESEREHQHLVLWANVGQRHVATLTFEEETCSSWQFLASYLFVMLAEQITVYARE